MAKPLRQHTPKHSLQPHLVAIVMMPHALHLDADAHLAARDIDRGVEEVKVGEGAVDAVVEYVDGFEPVIERIVDCDGPLEGAAFQGEGLDGGGLRVVVGVDPGLGARVAVRRDQEYDVF